MIKLNGIPVVPTMFPDKTSQVWKLPEQILQKTNYFHITWIFESEAEFMHLAQLKMLLDCETESKNTLRIKYLPYGRQDKNVTNLSTFALRTFAHLLNSLDFDEVIIHDPHSEVALEAIKRSKAQYPRHELLQIFREIHPDVICYPDKGATEKYSKEYNEFFGKPYIYGEKVRDQTTGNILSYKIRTEEYMAPFGQNVLIVDDICDGGMTFILLAKELYKAGAKEVNLFVSHGLFTKGIQVLKDSGIKKIFTTDGEVS